MAVTMCSYPVAAAAAPSGGKVYVTTIPLRVPAGPPSWFMSVVDAMGITQFRHCMTIIKAGGAESPCVVFDFQPLNPEDPFVALAVISGQKVSGMVQQRTMLKLPSRRCWLVGEMLPGLGVPSAARFNKSWCTDLVLHKHDCRHHTTGISSIFLLLRKTHSLFLGKKALVEYLTGKKIKLSQHIHSTLHFVVE